MFASLAQKRHSLVFRLLFYFILSIIALSLILAFSFTQRIRPHIQQQVLPNVERYLEYLISDIGTPPDIEVASELATRLPFEIRIEGPGQEWRSRPGIRAISTYRLRPAPPPYESIYYGHTRRNELVLIERQGWRYLFVIEDSFRRGSERRHWLLFVGFAAILLALYLVIRRHLRPIEALSEQVRRIGEGDLARSSGDPGRGELGTLARGIDQMAGQIRSMLENKSGMLLAISHELRSPLTRMRVNLELLDESDVRDQLIDDAREMEELLAAILESEKLSAGHAPLTRARINLSELVREVIDGHPDHHRIKPELVDVWVDADAMRLRLLLRNLLDNAAKYSTESDGDIIVRLDIGQESIKLQVIDHGVGIAPGDIDRLAQAFYRPDSARQRNTGGYGLGLYLCRLISEAHGGQLQIESSTEEGTRISVILPRDNS